MGFAFRCRFSSFFVILALALNGCQTTDFGKMLEQAGETETASWSAPIEWSTMNVSA